MPLFPNLHHLAKVGGGQGHVTPKNFWVLNANSSKLATTTNFKFGMEGPFRHDPWKIFSKSGHVQGDSENFSWP